jgi:hypothetical protein
MVDDGEDGCPCFSFLFREFDGEVADVVVGVFVRTHGISFGFMVF